MHLVAFDLVIVGGAGDLCFRKLMPALYQAFRHGALGDDFRLLSLSRSAMDSSGYRDWLAEKFDSLDWEEGFDREAWLRFAEHIEYQAFEALDDHAYPPVGDWVSRRATPADAVVFYLATSPDLFTSICQRMAAHGLNAPPGRVVLEKPLGHDLASAIAINQAVKNAFAESQIYRIDHYLGKQSVQNLLALRFGNSLFEPLWRRESVASVQITLAEDLGVEHRGGYYNRAGALRDMLQNHLLQLLCFVAMEPPLADDADAIRDEKLKVLRSLRPLSVSDVVHQVVRAQYRGGNHCCEDLRGYLDEADIPADSQTETYVALKAEIDNWRWAGVPFFLRTGKRLPRRLAEIVIQFKATPHTIYPIGSHYPNNRLVIRLQPEDEIQLHLFAKSSNRFKAEHGRLVPVALDLDFKEQFGSHSVEAYERLLRRIIAGRLDLFVRSDEQEAAWRYVMPILEAWQNDLAPLHSYAAGSWGPPAASALLARHDASWSEEIGG